ncbi:MAG: molybdenum cofactor biosynthesis protein MoaE, partial [Planktothrix agardhii]
MISNSLEPKLTENQPQFQDSFLITIAPLLLEEIYTLADDQRNGAIVVMSGMVRN